MTVAKKGRKKNNTSAKDPPTVAKPDTTTNPPAAKKGLTARERRLIIKREGAPLNTTALALRDDINQVLSGKYIQTVSIRGNTLTLTTMESIRATSLNSKVGTFLHLIPGTTTVQLDTPTTQLLVHGIPTNNSLAAIATELTTFNT